MKKTIKQLKEERQSSIDEMTALVNLSESEDRNLTETEQKDFDLTTSKVENLDSRIERLERSLNLVNNAPISHSIQDVANTDKDLRGFSFGAVIKAAYTGQVDGLIKELDAEARIKEPNAAYRGIAIPASVLQMRTALPAAAGDVKSVDTGAFVDQLEAASVLAKAGANFYTGLSADRKFPVISDITSSFVAENPSAVSESGAVTGLTISPNKIISVVGMSAEMMAQNTGVEAALRRNMVESIMATFESNLLSKVDKSAGPSSIYSDANAFSTAAALTDDILYGLETYCLGKNVDTSRARFAYLCSPNALGKVKGLAGTNFVNQFADLANKTINTHPYLVSSNVGNEATAGKERILFGDFSKVHIGQFGGISVLFDPYTNAAKGLGRLVVTSLVDGAAAQAGDVLAKWTKA